MQEEFVNVPKTAQVESPKIPESRHKALTLDEFINWAAIGRAGENYGRMSDNPKDNNNRMYANRSYKAQRQHYEIQDHRTAAEMIEDSLSAGTISKKDATVLQRHFNKAASVGDEALTKLREQISNKTTAFHTPNTPEYAALG